MENSKRTFIKIYLLFAAIFISYNTSAQTEELVPLRSNQVIKQYLENHPNFFNQQRQVVASLELPFIDDFSSSEVFPDPSKWSDNFVFINNDFCINPVSIGVATFDGLDGNGNPYINNNPVATGGCDTLTSQPINLLNKPSSQGGGAYSIADSIILSFYYQKKGRGDAPESTDSLVLDFYNASTGQWSRQWNAKGGISGGNDTVFFKVQYKLTNAAFLLDGFRFRFRTYGAKTGSLDNWNLDYIKLYVAYNSFSGVMDTVLRDVAFTQPGKSILTNYTSIPWDHFVSLSDQDQQNLIDDSSTVYFRVNDDSPSDVGFNNRIFNYAGNYVAGFGQINGNIFPGLMNSQNLKYTFPVDSIFPNTPSISADSNSFSIVNYFSNSNSLLGLSSNDTINYQQNFYNYYSYDDGTAEVAYDLVNSPNGQLAMRFDIIKPDTLRAVRFFFAQQALNVSNKLFTIKIWSNLSSAPIYQEFNQKPSYINLINGYSTYVLDQIVPVNGTIYIGFQQIAADGLHLGFDRNTASNSKMFFNTTGTWNPVNVAPGTFMIRPVMGDTSLFAGIENLSQSTVVKLFPNPASNSIRILVKSPELVDDVTISNLEGKQIISRSFSEEFSLDNLTTGLYIVEVRFIDKSIARSKLMIVKD